ncbi:MAG TPA: phosphatase PAP2 family protein [Actinomycetota bacterium]|nr:phosphatase PAP2 family protein [Actinomycetota bacterium]
MTRPSRRDARDLIWAVLAVGLLVLCAVAIHPNRASTAEVSVFRVANAIPDLVYWPVWAVMQLGNLLAAPAVALGAAILRRWRLAGGVLLVGAAKTLLSRVVKDLVTRERPASVIDDVVRRGDASAAGEAFVSGHAVIAFGLAVLVDPYMPPGRRWIPWALATAVCIGRVYVGAHLPLDVVGGAALGLAIGLVLRFALGGPARETRVRPTDGESRH